jgi:hypothetical protein
VEMNNLRKIFIETVWALYRPYGYTK